MPRVRFCTACGPSAAEVGPHAACMAQEREIACAPRHDLCNEAHVRRVPLSWRAVHRFQKFGALSCGDERVAAVQRPARLAAGTIAGRQKVEGPAGELCIDGGRSALCGRWHLAGILGSGRPHRTMLLRAALPGGCPRRRRSRWGVAGRSADDHIPRAVQALQLAAWIASLQAYRQPVSRRLLQPCACCGDHPALNALRIPRPESRPADNLWRRSCARQAPFVRLGSLAPGQRETQESSCAAARTRRAGITMRHTDRLAEQF